MQQTLSGSPSEAGTRVEDQPVQALRTKRTLSFPVLLVTIRARLLLLMLLPTFALVGLTVYYQLDQRAASEDRAKERLISSSAAVAQNQHQSYESARTFMGTLAALPEVRGAAEHPDSSSPRITCARRLAVAAESLSSALGLGLVDANGDRICSSTSAERGSANAADRIDFQAAVLTRDYAIGEVVQTRTTPNQPTMTVSMPVLDAGGGVLAVLRLGSDLSASRPLAIPVDAPHGSELSVVDRRGKIISSSTARAGMSVGPINFDTIDLPDFLSTALVRGDIAGDERQNIITRVTDSGSTPVYAVLSVPPSALGVPLGDVLWPELPIVLAISLAALAGAWFLGEFLIARRASALAESARRIRSGDFTYANILKQDSSELGQVSESFGEMAKQLDQTIEQLRHALNAKDEFLSLVSHELRTPVTMILGNSQMLVDHWDALAGDDRYSAIEDVLSNSQRLRRIIENLLVLARLDTGQPLEMEPLIMRRAVSKVVKAHRQQHPERTYAVISPEELWVVEGNLQCIEQTLDNLLSNAAKYSPKEAPITVRIWREGSELAVAVEDQGIGVDPAEVEELFSPFYRSAKTTEVSGVGLGLSVCLRLVQAQDGRIWARPNDGKGAVFAFSLPIATNGEEDLEVDLQPEAPAAATVSL